MIDLQGYFSYYGYSKPVNRLPIERRALIAHLLVEGSSLRSVERVTGADINTITSLLLRLGNACEEYQDRTLRELDSHRIEVDEIWSYIHTKEDHLKPEERGRLDRGDSYTWIAIDPDSKLVPWWHVGKRTTADAITFMSKLAPRFAGKIQITTDGFEAYRPAIEDAFGTEADYAQLYKVMKDGLEGISAADFLNKRRYTQPTLEATSTRVISGNPDLEMVGTSIIERHNRTVRMKMRRMGRAVDSFSKTFEHHKAAMALVHMHYNFARIHKTIRCTPAMEAGVTDHVWTMQEIAALEPVPVVNRPKTYRKRAA